MADDDFAALKAKLQKVSEDLQWIAEQLIELRRDYEREAEANREDFQQLNPNRKNKIERTYANNELRGAIRMLQR